MRRLAEAQREKHEGVSVLLRMKAAAQAHPSVLSQRALLYFGQVKVGPQAASFSAAGELHGEILAFRCIKKAAMA